MNEVRATITTDSREELTNLLRRLPAILSGRVPDEKGIAAGFRARIGYTILSLIAPNFNELGRGQIGADGTKWPPLTREYLAYGRRFGPGEQASLKKAAGLNRNNRLAPNDKKGLLTPDQLRLWRKTYSIHRARLLKRFGEAEAGSIAAGIAWNTVKAMGAKTKLEVYGGRTVQILVDTGRLRGSLQPGTLSEQYAYAEYNKPSVVGGPEQEFEVSEPYKVIVGTNVKYAKYHHNAKSPKRRRRLWPEHFPSDWWSQILGAAISGLSRIPETFRIGA